MIDLQEEDRNFLKQLTKLKPQLKNGYYVFVKRKKSYKRSRVFMQLYLNKKLNIFELVHHKDKNKMNDSINNLEVLNSFEHRSMHNDNNQKMKPINWKPANTIKPEVILKAREIKKNMIKVNYSEISRQLKKYGFDICSCTIKRYLE